MQVDKAIRCGGSGYERFWKLVWFSLIIVLMPVPVVAQGSAYAESSGSHALGSSPCAMQDQAWEKNIGPSHPLDVAATVGYLKKNGFDCYVLGISTVPPYSFGDLKRLLPALRGTNISVWAELFPPGEPSSQLPYKEDYVKWMQELGKLAHRYPALRGVNIDDFLATKRSRDKFTRAYTCQIYDAEKQANPHLLFIPTVYEIIPATVSRLSGCVDGVKFSWTNLDSVAGMRSQLMNARLVVGGRFPIYVGVYAHSTSWHQAREPLPRVFKAALEVGCRYSNGVIMWNLSLAPDSQGNQLLVVARNFTSLGTADLAGKCGTLVTDERSRAETGEL